MPERKPPHLPFESSDPHEQKLWAALEDLPRDEPSPGLRRGFYDALEHRDARRPTARLQRWLGLAGSGGWLTAAACVLLGFGLARSLPAPPVADERLAALENNVAQLNRELVLNRLESPGAGARLQAVLDAGGLAGSDGQVARALLLSAAQDPSESVRSAAIDALGPQLGNEDVARELMQLLESAESPLVQWSLVDLVLRHGDREQVRQLVQLADASRLHPDLARHVRQAVSGGAI